MKNTVVKIIGITLVLILLMQNSLYALTEKEQLEKEQSKINNQIEEMEKKQEELEKQKSTALKAVEKVIGQISNSQREIDSLKNQASDLEEQIKTKTNDIQQKQEEYTKQEGLLNSRLIAIYKNGNTSYLDMLLKSSNMSDFLAKYYLASELIECDKELIQTTKEQKAQIENEKLELENNKKQLDESITQAEKKQKELEDLQKEKQEYAKQLTDEEKKIQKEIEELEKDNREIERQIKIAEEKYRKQLEELAKNSGSGSTAGSGFFMRPVSGGSITATAYYSSGKFHGGVDYGVPVGTKVVAAADGVVMSTANLTGSYGTYVVIRHANGLQSYYAHGTKGSIVVSPGDTVKKGQKIMLSGNTGNSSGPHLHFEVRKSPYNYSYNAKAYGQDSRVNPLNYL